MKTMIIAEAGVNHNGHLDIAKKLIDEAAAAGVDYVKFQTFKASKLVTGTAVMADYQETNMGVNMTQHQMLQQLELKEEYHRLLIDHCEKAGVAFLSTPFDEDSITFLASLGMKIGKIPSGEITNLPYLEKMAATFPVIILSTGMSTMQEIKNAINILLENGATRDNITILHCNTEYPTPMQDVNLLAMNTIKTTLDVNIGYSDHTLGIEVPIAAVALGATIIEKHFTLDRTMPGPDHKASLEPDELKAMVKSIRNIEQALGSGFKEPSLSELKNMAIARKSIVAARDIPNGTVITREDLVVKRPGTGISPMEFYRIIGQKASRNLVKDELITYKDIF